MIIFDIQENYLTVVCKEQSELLRTQVNSYLRSSGFWWDKDDYCWKIFGLYAEESIFEKLEFLDEIQGIGIRSFRLFKKILEEKDWVRRLDVKLDDDCFKFTAKNRSQKSAISKIISHEGFILKCEVGWGKTFATCTSFNHLEKYKIVDKLFIISVNSVLWNWKSELKKFTWIKDEEIFIMDSKKNRDPWTNSDKYKVIICSYDNYKVLINDIYKANNTTDKARTYEKKYCYHKNILEWSKSFMLCIDETHFTSSQSSKNNKYIKGLSLIANQVTTMTGTLYRKHRTEIFQQMSIIAPEIVDNVEHKSDKYQKFLSYTAELWAEHTTNVKKVKDDKMDYLDKLFYKYIHEGKTEINVEKTQSKILVKLSDKHMKFYKEVAQLILSNRKDEDEGVSTQSFLNNYTLFSQVLSDPSMIINKYPEELSNFKWKLEDNEKFKVTLDIIEEHPDDKIIIWILNPFVIDQVYDKLKKYKPLKYHGQTEIPKGKTRNQYKDELIKEFNETNKYRILITNQSMSTGLNITGANVSILHTIPNNYVDFNQLAGRIYRHGQTKHTYYYNLVAEGTLDEISFHNLDDRGYINKLSEKYKYLRKDQIKSLLLGQIIE